MQSKRKIIIITAIIVCLLCAIVVVTILVNRKKGNTFNTVVESVSEPEADGHSQMSDDIEEGDEPDEFKDEPDIIIPAAVEDIETMVTQESGEIDLEEDQGGSF